MSHSLATIITYCTNDYRFISRCVSEAKQFSRQIVIPVCDHFFDGTPENRSLLERTYADHPDCSFIEFPYLPDRLYSPYHNLGPTDPDWPAYWAATTRYIGLHYLDPSIDQVLFLDSDEILEGQRFLAWLDTQDYLNYDAQRLGAYLYAVSPTLRSKKLVNLPLLARKTTLAPLTLLNGLERIGAYLMHPGSKRERVLGIDQKPLVHHYSWVRTKQECLQKARTWSHRSEQDWPTLIERAFAGDPSVLFETHPDWETTPPYFDPFRTFPHVSCITPQSFLLKTLEAL